MKISIAHASSQSSLNGPENSMPNFPKINCAFHPNEVITNFCTCECCLLPLCPACIKIHTNQHITLKNINPQYEPINELLEEVYQQVQEEIDKTSISYSKINEVDAKIGTFRTAIQQKILNLKNSIISQTQTYFTKLEQQLTKKIDNISYIKLLNQYKDQTKKSIIGLKNVEKSFNLDNAKLMRLIIKYKGCSVRQQLGDYNSKIQQFLSQINSNFITFSIREDFKQSLNNYLDSINKVEISDISTHKTVPQVFNRIKQVYEKQSETSSKKQIMKSLGTLLQNNLNNYNSLKNSEIKKQKQSHSNSQLISSINSQILTQNYNSVCSKQKTQSYNSVSHEIGNMQYLTLPNQQRTKIGTPIKHLKQNEAMDKKRRSLSKGKGLSLMQMNTVMITNQNYPGMAIKNNGRRVGAFRGVDISQPVQLSRQMNRTAIIRRSDFQ